MANNTDLAPPPANPAVPARSIANDYGPADQPVIYAVAGQLHLVLHLSREEHLGIWRRVIALYRQVGRSLPSILQSLGEEAFIESLIENEVFWALAGQHANRDYYSHATDYLSAVYATAALLVARRDSLPLSPADQGLLLPA
jgi:hypothetical protein